MSQRPAPPPELANGNLIRYRLDQAEKELDTVSVKVDGALSRLVEIEEWRDGHDKRQRSIEDKLDAANAWLRGVLTSLVVALLLLLLNLMVAQRNTERPPPAASKAAQP